ncbi:hypothetical protein NKH77_43090 [Streptomyces sp. M19]
MLTGEAPFGATQDIGTLVERAMDHGVPLLQGHPGVPDPLARVVDVLCAWDLRARPEGAQDVQHALAAPAEAEERVADLVRGCVRDQACAGGPGCGAGPRVPRVPGRGPRRAARAARRCRSATPRARSSWAP